MTDHSAGPPDHQVLAAIRDLCQWIEDVVTGWQDLEALVRVLDLSAHAFFMTGDYRLAARHWMRALEINRAHAVEYPHAYVDRVSILESLSRLYHETQRPLKAIEVERELVALHQAADQTALTAHDCAQALAQLGSTMIATDQFDGGREYLVRADQAFQALGRTTPKQARAHVRVLELLAEAYRRQHEPAEARRYEDRATKVAADPLVPITYVIYELHNSLTTVVDQVATLAHEVTAVVDAIGDEGQPQPAGLAKVPGGVATWYDLASSVDALGFQLKAQVRAIAEAAGNEIVGPRQRTKLAAVFELSEWVAYIARKRGDFALQIELLDRSARVFFTAEDDRCAQMQWGRALKLADELPYTVDATTAVSGRAIAIRILEARSDLYHAANRLEAAIDVETQLVDRHRYANDQPATARALARLGSTMVTAQRYDCAEVYLTEADVRFQALGTLDPTTASHHADTLELLATVFDHRGRLAEAIQCHRRMDALRAASPHPHASHDHLNT